MVTNTRLWAAFFAVFLYAAIPSLAGQAAQDHTGHQTGQAGSTGKSGNQGMKGMKGMQGMQRSGGMMQCCKDMDKMHSPMQHHMEALQKEIENVKNPAERAALKKHADEMTQMMASMHETCPMKKGAKATSAK